MTNRRSRVLLAPFAIVVALSMATSSCSFRNLSFVQDRRLEITSPNAAESVALPFTVRWRVEDFEGTVVVFFDRSPMKPGSTVKSLVPDDDPCRAEAQCPDAAWLADHDIYVTTSEELLVSDLSDRRVSPRSKDRHDLTIVLLNEAGERVGDTAFTREFVVIRDQS